MIDIKIIRKGLVFIILLLIVSSTSLGISKKNTEQKSIEIKEYRYDSITNKYIETKTPEENKFNDMNNEKIDFIKGELLVKLKSNVILKTEKSTGVKFMSSCKRKMS